MWSARSFAGIQAEIFNIMMRRRTTAVFWILSGTFEHVISNLARIYSALALPQMAEIKSDPSLRRIWKRCLAKPSGVEKSFDDDFNTPKLWPLVEVIRVFNNNVRTPAL